MHLIHSRASYVLLLFVISLVTAPAYGFDDSNLADDYDETLDIYFRVSGTSYIGLEPNAAIFITGADANFDMSHASVGIAKLKHRHAQYNYGSGPTTPVWGASPSWPDVSEGNAYWNWIYPNCARLADCDTQVNCVSFAFGLSQWVESASDSDPLWGSLSTCVFGDSNCDEMAGNGLEAISNGDIAGNQQHVWVLSSPNSLTSAAETLTWRNNCSGTYVYNHVYVGDNRACNGSAWGLNSSLTTNPIPAGGIYHAYKIKH